jgi:HSP20 family protein
MAEKTVPAPQRGETLPAQEGTRAQEQYVAPPVDIYETPDGLTVLADLPGVRKEDLDVEVKDDILTIRAHAHDRLPGDLVYREFELVSFFRQFQLSDKVDAAKITAEFKHGVLTLRLPKAEELKPKQIAVQVE